MKNERNRTLELNMLSAYLDNELSAAERQTLETRLKQEPELHEQLQNLQKTKIILSHLKRHHAPRNFTLTPDMVTVRRGKRKPLFTVLRLASSLAAILLVVLFGVDMLAGGLLQGQPQTASDPMMEFASVADETEPEPLIIWVEPGVGGGGTEGDMRGMGSDGLGAEEPILEMEPVIPEPEQEEQALPPESPVTDPTLPPEESVESFSADAQESDEKSIILGINPDQGGEIVSQSQPSDSAQDSPFRRLNAIQWIQIGLAIIAIGGALGLLFLRRKQLT